MGESKLKNPLTEFKLSIEDTGEPLKDFSTSGGTGPDLQGHRDNGHLTSPEAELVRTRWEGHLTPQALAAVANCCRSPSVILIAGLNIWCEVSH